MTTSFMTILCTVLAGYLFQTVPNQANQSTVEPDAATAALHAWWWDSAPFPSDEVLEVAEAAAEERGDTAFYLAMTFVREGSLSAEDLERRNRLLRRAAELEYAPAQATVLHEAVLAARDLGDPTAEMVEALVELLRSTGCPLAAALLADLASQSLHPLSDMQIRQLFFIPRRVGLLRTTPLFAQHFVRHGDLGEAVQLLKDTSDRDPASAYLFASLLVANEGPRETPIRLLRFSASAPYHRYTGQAQVLLYQVLAASDAEANHREAVQVLEEAAGSDKGARLLLAREQLKPHSLFEFDPRMVADTLRELAELDGSTGEGARVVVSAVLLASAEDEQLTPHIRLVLERSGWAIDPEKARQVLEHLTAERGIQAETPPHTRSPLTLRRLTAK